MLYLIIKLSLIATSISVGGIVLLRQPFWGLVLMVALIPVEALTTLGVGRTIIAIIGLATFGAWFIRLILQKGTIRLSMYPTFLVILWLIWGMLSYVWAFDQEITWTRSLFMVQALFFFFLIQNLVSNNKKLKIILIVFFVSTLVCSVFAIERGLGEKILRTSVAQEQSPAHLAESLGMGILVIPYLLKLSRSRFVKFLLFISSFIIALAILMTSTRGAMIGVVAAFFLTWIITLGRAFRLRTIVIVGIVFVVGFIYVSTTEIINKYAYQRMATIYSVEKTQGGSGRTNIWAIGWEMVKDHPVIGVGLQNFPIRFRNYIDIADFQDKAPVKRFRDPHNIFLAIQSELGIIGMIIFLSFLFFLVKDLVLKRDDPRAILGLLFIFFLLTSGAVITLLYRKYFWLAIGIATVIPMIYKDEKN